MSYREVRDPHHRAFVWRVRNAQREYSYQPELYRHWTTDHWHAYDDKVRQLFPVTEQRELVWITLMLNPMAP